MVSAARKGWQAARVPAHHLAEAYVDAYLDAAGVREDRKGWLFRSVDRRLKLTNRRLSETDVYRMIKRRADAGGVPDSTCCHTFRATGITAYLQNGGTLEKGAANRQSRVAADDEVVRSEQ